MYTPIRIPKDMGIVWEAYHKGVPLLGVPRISLEYVNRTATKEGDLGDLGYFSWQVRYIFPELPPSGGQRQPDCNMVT